MLPPILLIRYPKFFIDSLDDVKKFYDNEIKPLAPDDYSYTQWVIDRFPIFAKKKPDGTIFPIQYKLS